MLFWIVLALTIMVSIAIIVMKVNNFDFYYDFITLVMEAILTVLIIVSIIMGTTLLCVRTTDDAYTSAMEQRYKSLTYQLENDMYNNDNEYGKKELYDHIQSWNEDLASGREMQDNFWIGIFYHHVYDRFEFIELPVRQGHE